MCPAAGLVATHLDLFAVCFRNKRPRATAAAARRASETMFAGANRPAVQHFRRDIPKKKVRAFGISDLHAEHLIKIAVVNLTPPADAQGRSAHETVHGCRI